MVTCLFSTGVVKAKLTFPADKPRSEIDCCVARLAGVKGEAKVLDEAVASDHRPLVTELEWEE